ncbi:MAG: TonB-dependent receptor plug domain-containing protein [Nibricoccus sp.]
MSSVASNRSCVGVLRLFLSSALLISATLSSFAQNNTKKNFNVPAGDAAATLKAFADQSGEQIIFPAEQVRGTQTKAVQGELTPRDALNAMVADTNLVIVQDNETGALVVKKKAQPDTNPTPPPRPKAAIPTAPVDSAKIDSGNEIFVLSPFEIRDTNEGYYASSSLSGTRINSNLEDLASSISVITRQQITDTASLDINDIFKYEANTEGMSQYTEYTIDRSFYKETTTLAPQSANRIRGISSANRTVNNFAVSSVIPLDAYNTESIEISRGPNANIFGLGNASGTVNVNTSRAGLTRDQTQIVGRTDNNGQRRGSISLNRVLWKNRAAVLVQGLYDDKGFERQPAYETIKRVTVAATVKPFQSTTLRGSFETYRNSFSRANTTLPRDAYTEWNDTGRPVWNPVTSTWRYLDNSASGTVATANESRLPAPGLATGGFPLGLFPQGSGFWQSPSVYIEPDGTVSFYSTNGVSNSATSPTVATPANRYVETGSMYRRTTDITTIPTPNQPLSLPLYQALSITSKSIYDRDKINFLAPNYGKDNADIAQVELEQWFLRKEQHQVGLQVGLYKERINTYSHSVFADSDSAAPFLAVDVNEFLIDGSPNPYFLRPYLGGSAPTIKYGKEDNTDARATLVYLMDLTKNQGWSKWLGKHNFVAYGERRDMRSTYATARDINITDYTWSSTNEKNSLPVRGNIYRQFPRYYLGDAVTNPGPIVDYAPATHYNLGNTPLTWFQAATRARVNENAQIMEVIQSATPGVKDREIRTQGITWQGFFWNDRIVTTWGWRYDRNRERSTRNLNSNPYGPSQLTSTVNPATRLNDFSLLEYFPFPWEQKVGKSRNEGIVFKATKWLNLNYSQSNSFKPELLAYDINTNVLPNPTGKSKDYGFTLKLFDDKLIARVTRYETVEKNSRNGSITSAAVTRTLRLLFDPSSSNALTSQTATVGAANYNVTFGSNGQDGFDLEQLAAQWYMQSWAQTNSISPGPVPADVIAAAQQYAVNTYLAPLGIDQAYIDRIRALGASAFTDVNTVTSKGVEVELTFNPNRYWTLKIAGAQQKAIDSELGHAVTDYINNHLVPAESIVIPTNAATIANGTAGKLWWQTGATGTASGTSTPTGFYIANVKSVIGLATANAGKPRPQTREYQVNMTTNYQLAGAFDNRFLKRTSVGGSLRWASRSAVGYYGAAPDPLYNYAVVDYDANRPIYDKARTYVDLKLAHDLPLWNDKVRCKIQLNVNNIFENGHLQPIAYNPDGRAWGYRIVDPRQFILTVSFDL